MDKADLPTHIKLPAGSCGLTSDSIILAEQLRTIDKQRLQIKVGKLKPEIMQQVNKALKVGLNIG